MPLFPLARAAVGFACISVLMAVFVGPLRFAVSLVGCVAGSASLLALPRLLATAESLSILMGALACVEKDRPSRITLGDVLGGVRGGERLEVLDVQSNGLLLVALCWTDD